MTGYYKYSLSNNALIAYDEGKKPISQFKKSDLELKNLFFNIKRLNDECGNFNFENIKEAFILKQSIRILQNFSVKDLKKFLKEEVKSKEYHHTSKYYNSTDFYDIAEAVSKIYFWKLGGYSKIEDPYFQELILKYKK